MAHYKFADVLEGKGDENVLDNSHACGDLHRTRNQRLLAGRVLIPRHAVEASPSAYRAGGLGLSVCLRSGPFCGSSCMPCALRQPRLATYSQENVALPNRNCAAIPAARPL